MLVQNTSLFRQQAFIDGVWLDADNAIFLTVGSYHEQDKPHT